MLLQQMTLMIPVVAHLRGVRMTDEKIKTEIISRNTSNIRRIKIQFHFNEYLFIILVADKH